MIEIIQAGLLVVIAVLALGVLGWTHAARAQAARPGQTRPTASPFSPQRAPSPRRQRAPERPPEPQRWPSA